VTRHDCRVSPVRHRPSGRRITTVLAGLVLAFLAVLAGPAAPASAHAVLVGSNPAANAIVNPAPTQVVLTFSEGVNPVKGKVRVIAPDGSRADTDEARPSGSQLIIPLKSGSAAGTYLVTYRVISADSHPIGGAYTFSVIRPSAPPSANEAQPPVSQVVLDTLPVMRWIGYVGLLLLVGSVLVLALLWPQRLPRGGPTRVIWLGAGLITLATVGELLLQIPYVAGGGLSNITSSDVQEVLSSQYGAAHLIRLGVLGAALVLLRPIVAGKGWGADRVLLAVLGTIGVATWSVSGHPSASPIPSVTVIADMIHIASMSIWIGGLVMLAVFLLPRANATELGAIVPVWSRWAMYAVSALIVTGVAQALVEVGTVDALVKTTYGLMVCAKALLALVVLAIANLSRRLVPTIAAEGEETDQSAAASAGSGTSSVAVKTRVATSDSVPRLRRLVIAEASVAAVVLGVTSVLVQVTPARTASTQVGESSSVQSAVLEDKLFTLTVDISPSTVGINEVHLYAATPSGQPADIKEWHVKASLPEKGIEPIDAAILVYTPDHSVGQIGLPQAGNWTFTFTLRTTDIDQDTVTTTFVVRP
jgi:copper transport protein